MITLNNILFIDIETVPQYAAYQDVPDAWKQLWEQKTAYLLRNNEEDTPESIYGRAGIYAEFGKIICISCGIIQGNSDTKKLILKSYRGHDERDVLLGFTDMLTKWCTGENKVLCAHNGKEFDFPYLCRRLIVHQIPIPAVLNIAGKKPWEIKLLDTMDMWKFGDYKSYTSLDLLAHTLGVPSPKDDIDGKMVAQVYYEEQNLERIVTYCQKDVITLTRVYLRLHAYSTIEDNFIEVVS